MHSLGIADPRAAEAPTIALEDAIRAVRSVVAMGEPAEADVSADSTFEELGLSSLDFTEVLVALEETIHRAVDVESISADLVTVGDLTRLRLVPATS